MKIFKRALSLSVICLALFPVGALGQKLMTLTDVQGREIQAEAVMLEAERVKIILNKKEIWLPLAKLNPESKEAVVAEFARRGAEHEKKVAGMLELPNGEEIRPEKVHRFTLELTEEEKEWAKIESVSAYEVSVAFPPEFDPSKKYPVFFTNDTRPGKNADKVRSYAKVATQAGYVVIGAQATSATPENVLSSWRTRGVVTHLAILNLAKNWPSLMNSEWYYGGYSGGAKNCCYLAVFLYEEHGRAASGFYMGGCNEMKMTPALETYKSDKKAFKDTAFFISNGDKDKIATPEQGEEIAKILQKERFKTVRQEVFDGGHVINHEHVTEALKWFDQLRAERKSE